MRRASAERRQIGDRHGMFPRSMVSLRWRYAKETDEPSVPVLPEDRVSSTDRRRRLMIVNSGGGTA